MLRSRRGVVPRLNNLLRQEHGGNATSLVAGSRLRHRWSLAVARKIRVAGVVGVTIATLIEAMENPDRP